MPSITDTDGDGTVDSEDTDDDNDGMPDACEVRYGFNPLDASDGGSTNTDGDGASNVYECKHGTDPTATPANNVLADTDGDGMYDAWESNNGLDPDDSTDASLNDDGDGYSNLEEFTAGTDPQWDQSHPGSIPELQFGFNAGYTVQVGTINTGDTLKDILVRNPTVGILPSVSDFVLIQNRNGGFEIEDSDDYTISTSSMTDISTKAKFVDINGDGAKDLVLTGLNSGSAAIPGANDQVVYGNYHERYTIPEMHIALTATRKKFFKDLSGWIDDENYFGKNVPISSSLEIDEAENTDEDQVRSTGFQGYLTLGYVTLSDTYFQQNAGKCIGLTPDLCYILSEDGFRGRLDPFTREQLRIRIEGTNQIYLDIRSGVSGSTRPTKVNLYDISNFDEDARMLALYYLQPIRKSGSLQPGANNSKVVSEMLETILQVPVLENLLLSVGEGILPQIEDHTSYTGIVSDILRSMDFSRDRIVLPALQIQVTEEERNSSSNLDALDKLPKCSDSKITCNPSNFSDQQKSDINVRLQQLAEELRNSKFATSDAAALAIHNSEFHKFGREIGIEFFAIIENRNGTYQIGEVGTDFYENRVTIPRYSGNSYWHNHPGGTAIWEHDATVLAIYNLNEICSKNLDYFVYASAGNLTKAKVKQMVDIEDHNMFTFQYEIHQSNVWRAYTSSCP